MATQLDLQDQEQLDTLKAFWKQYGNLITWTLILGLGGFAAYNGWNWYQRDQGAKAGAMYEELDRAVAAGDAERAGRVLGDLRQRYPATAFTQQAALATAKLQFDKGQADAAQASLQWLVDNAKDGDLGTVARLRLAGLQLQAQQYDAALKTLDGAKSAGFEGLLADRRGDVLAAQGQSEQALAAYKQAFQALGDRVDYRRVVDAKLTALGAPPGAASAAASAPAGKAAP